MINQKKYGLKRHISGRRASCATVADALLLGVLAPAWYEIINCNYGIHLIPWTSACFFWRNSSLCFVSRSICLLSFGTMAITADSQGPDQQAVKSRFFLRSLKAAFRRAKSNIKSSPTFSAASWSRESSAG